MGRYSQTLARLGAGFSSLGTLAWLFWPDDLSSFWDPEPLFAFSVATVVWVFTEFKTSEEAVPAHASPNDIRNARDLLRLHSEEFRILLNEHDTFQFLMEEYYGCANRLLNRWEIGQFVFQNRELNELFGSFCAKLEAFQSFIGLNTVPEEIGGRWRVGFKPRHIVTEEEYNARFAKSRTAIDLASSAWQDFDTLCEALHKQIPEALNEPLVPLSWFDFNPS